MRMLLDSGVGGRVGRETTAATHETPPNACLTRLPEPGQGYAHWPALADARINGDTMW